MGNSQTTPSPNPMNSIHQGLTALHANDDAFEEQQEYSRQLQAFFGFSGGGGGGGALGAAPRQQQRASSPTLSSTSSISSGSFTFGTGGSIVAGIGNNLITAAVAARAPATFYDPAAELAHNPADGHDFCLALPEDCIILILLKLGPDDVNSAALVCKEWHAIIKQAEPVWRNRCVGLWGHVRTAGLCGSWRQAYKILGQGTVLANTKSVQDALAYLTTFELCGGNSPKDSAAFLAGTQLVSRAKVGGELVGRTKEEKVEILSAIFSNVDFKWVFLPNALRHVFSKVSIEGTMASSRSVVPIFAAFIDAYIAANPDHGPKKESLHLLCYSCLLLGVDLFNKHVKEKMTKREFSRNNRSVLDDEHYDLAYLDRIYDNIKELGPIVHPRKEPTAADALAALT